MHSGRSEESHFEELLYKLQDVAAKGWIPTKRRGDTGVGFTLETLLGIEANSSRKPDFKGIEIKASRVRGTGKKITLFSKTPAWGSGGRVGLLNDYGSIDSSGRWSIYTTIHSKKSASGWRLGFDDVTGRLHVYQDETPVVYWERETLETALTNKHHETAFVHAETRECNGNEEFRYTGVSYARQASIDNFMRLIGSGNVVQDFAMHRTPSGGVRDHGFLFRINSNYLKDLFADVTDHQLG